MSQEYSRISRAEDIRESVDIFAKDIENAQIFMSPVVSQEVMNLTEVQSFLLPLLECQFKEAVMELLNNRDGLVLGIVTASRH